MGYKRQHFNSSEKYIVLIELKLENVLTLSEYICWLPLRYRRLINKVKEVHEAGFERNFTLCPSYFSIFVACGLQ